VAHHRSERGGRADGGGGCIDVCGHLHAKEDACSASFVLAGR